MIVGNGHTKPKPARRMPRLARVRRKFSMTVLRCNELNRIFRDRYGEWNVPNDDAGRDDVQIMAHHLIKRSADARLVRQWIDANAAWMTADEAGDLIERITSRPIRWRADTLAKRLNLTEADRSRLGIRTIGAVDMSKEERKQRRKRAQRERDRRNRKARGAKPRAEYEAGSANQTRPWCELGISRRTWYRRQRAASQKSGDSQQTQQVDDPLAAAKALLSR
jgi:hypothetical protein